MRLSHLKVTWKQPVLDELTSFFLTKGDCSSHSQVLLEKVKIAGKRFGLVGLVEWQLKN